MCIRDSVITPEELRVLTGAIRQAITEGEF